MFLSTTLLYPLELALLCVGTGLLVDRASGGFLPLALLPATGLAGLIAVTQLSTYAYPLAPATPYVAGAVAVVGFVVGRCARGAILRAARERPWLLLLPGRRVCDCARAGARVGPGELLLLHGAGGLRRAPGGCRLPAPPRPALRPSRPAQLLRPGDQRLLQLQLPLRCGHRLRGQRDAPRAAADLGLPALQRVRAGERIRCGLAAGAGQWPLAGGGCCGGADGRARGAGVRLRAVRVDQGGDGAGHDPRARGPRRDPGAVGALLRAGA